MGSKMDTIRFYSGTSSFRELREKNGYFVDKSLLIEELLSQNLSKVSLITRPRRFGKSLNMSMLEEFFNREKESSEIFKGLRIADNQELCAQWMNRHPVLSVSLRLVEGKTFSPLSTILAPRLKVSCVKTHFSAQAIPSVPR